MILLNDNKIASVYLGDSKIARVYRGDDLVYEDAPWKKLYQRLESVGITYTGPNMHNYVDTGIKPQIGQTIKIKLIHHGNPNNRRTWFWGIFDEKAYNPQGNGNINNRQLYKSYALCCLQRETYNYGFSYPYFFGNDGNTWYWNFNIDTDTTFEFEFNINADTRRLKVTNIDSNTIIYDHQHNVTFYESPYTYYLMLASISGEDYVKETGSNYYYSNAIASYLDYEVYQNGVLIQKLIPCYDINVTSLNADKYGYLDSVSKVFLPIQGRYSIRVGNEIPW